ncbi:MAG: trypsin-like peptidase domain-containing protein [Verrucomicrobiales bacterium]|nr:trypsin-like peptidase domain-containing protein [Verrucomicrobiales bacterium]
MLLAVGVALVAALVVREWRGDEGRFGLFALLAGDKPGGVFSLPTKSRLNLEDVELLTRLDAEYASLAEAVLPSVVSVTTRTVRRGSYAWHPIWGLLAERDQVIPGLGSGAIVSKEGHVVTNFHVIQGVTEVVVTTQDNREYPARILGADSHRDIAVLHIESNRRDFPALPLADSDAVRVGQLVVAVGNPFGLSGTVTRGAISARDRHLSDESLDYLQTDAVINPGNSGGPLVNVRGEIIGINVAILGRDENVQAWQGVGLAVPSNEAKAVLDWVMDQVKLKGSDAVRERVPGYLGLELAAEPVKLDPALNLGTWGAMVLDTLPGSPAQRSGLSQGDVIASIDGQPVQSPAELLKGIQGMLAGQPIRMKVVRGGQVVDLQATLAPRPELR